jgi:hypothetical protein
MLCPSASPDLPEALVVGVVDRVSDEPIVAYLQDPIEVSPVFLEMASPLKPTEVFRFAAACQTSACQQWNGHGCGLVERLVRLVPPSAVSLPRCSIRKSCRWFHEQGGQACRRCTSVVTYNDTPSDEMRLAATMSDGEAVEVATHSSSI